MTNSSENGQIAAVRHDHDVVEREWQAAQRSVSGGEMGPAANPLYDEQGSTEDADD